MRKSSLGLLIATLVACGNEPNSELSRINCTVSHERASLDFEKNYLERIAPAFIPDNYLPGIGCVKSTSSCHDADTLFLTAVEYATELAQLDLCYSHNLINSCRSRFLGRRVNTAFEPSPAATITDIRRCVDQLEGWNNCLPEGEAEVCVTVVYLP